MPLFLHNTLSDRKEEFTVQADQPVRIYSCGPTVYNFAHIGNLRSYVFTDTLRRSLKYLGYKVDHAMNITDVDDKTIQCARDEGTTLKDYTEKFTDEFFTDLSRLKIEKLEHYPRATHCIDSMLNLVDRLEQNGLTYQKEGSTYFSIANFKGYGKLSNVEADNIISGARYDADEYEKDDVRDFVLWKAPKDEGEDRWPSKWGDGRPGWHLECSSMIHEVFGGGIDIHTGGIDLVFPHHENEIAQSRGAWPEEDFVRYWLHNEHLLVEGKKMSKSLGNFYTLRDLLDKGYSPRAVRYVLASAHYRSKLNFTFESLDAARSSLHRLDSFFRRLDEAGIQVEQKYIDQAAKLKAAVNQADGRPADLAEDMARFEGPVAREVALQAALEDDLNYPRALAELFELVREGNRLLDSFEKNGDSTERESIISELQLYSAQALLWDSAFGFIAADDDAESDLDEAAIDELVARRNQARADKDFALADQIRDQLLEMGIEIKDAKGQTHWHRSQGS